MRLPAHVRRARERGSILLVTMVVLAVLALMAVAAIAVSGQEAASATQVSRAEEIHACAEVARQNVLARLRLVGIAPQEIIVNTQLPDDAVASRRANVRTGHYDQTSVTDVQVITSGIGATTRQARDLSNLLAANQLGGQYYRIVAHCEGRGKQSEVEFMIRFGL